MIKVERPEIGELGRRLYISNLELEGDSTLFHSINRNKESFAADLKDPEDHERVMQLVRRSDVLIHNFRPGVIERLGLDYATLRSVNPRLVYAWISGYGTEGPWRDQPGQDLLAQSMSGLTWLTGDGDQGPVPMGLSVADMFAGAHAVQGILACLVRRGITGEGGLVEVSLMESVLDFQFEVLTTHMNDGGKLPERSRVNNAHAYLSAPYGIYETADGYIALSMGPLQKLGELLECPEIARFDDPSSWFTKRDEIKALIATCVRLKTTAAWLETLQQAGYWCAEVYDWPRLLEHEGFKALRMTQTVRLESGATLQTLRCPIRVDGGILYSPRGAPRVGADTKRIRAEIES